MGPSFELREPDHFTAGAVGPPGQRVFYLQATEGDQQVTLKVEKQQVQALCEHLGAMLADLPEVDPDAPDTTVGTDFSLRPPVEPQWPVGSMGVAYEANNDRILLVVEELGTDDDDDDDDLDLPWDDTDTGGGRASARFLLRRPLVAAFVRHGLTLTAAGRPSCEWCGFPIDPDGHACPRLN